MHLGRALAALPEDLRSRARELGPEQAWKDAVRLAIEEQVDAVLLAGDLVDNSRDFFVAYGHLKKGAEALAAEGIEILAVAGNHDTEILPRLAASIDRLQLVGEGGKWQAVELDELVVLGWSFRSRRFTAARWPACPAGTTKNPPSAFCTATLTRRAATMRLSNAPSWKRRPSMPGCLGISTSLTNWTATGPWATWVPSRRCGRPKPAPAVPG